MIKTQDLLTNGPCKLHAGQNYECTNDATCSAPSVFVHEHIVRPQTEWPLVIEIN